MPITVNDFEDLAKNALVQWAKSRGEFPSVRSTLANIVTVAERDSEHSNITDTETAKRRGDGDDAEKGDVKQGFTVTYRQEEIALQMDVTKQQRMFDKYDEIMMKARRMGKGTERRIELDLAAFLSQAWATTYDNIDGETITVSSPDGKALIDPTHSLNGSSESYSNEIPTTHSPISNDVLEILEEQFNGFLDDDGRNIPIDASHIITSRHSPTRHEVAKILGTTNNEAGTMDFNKNTFLGKYKPLVVPFLTTNPQTEAVLSSRNRYVFLAQLDDKDVNGFRIEFSQDIRFEPPEQVFESSIWQFLTTALYDQGLLRAQFIVGTQGNGNSV